MPWVRFERICFMKRELQALDMMFLLETKMLPFREGWQTIVKPLAVGKLMTCWTILPVDVMLQAVNKYMFAARAWRCHPCVAKRSHARFCNITSLTWRRFCHSNQVDLTLFSCRQLAFFC
jgi:hypothetical protein